MTGQFQPEFEDLVSMLGDRIAKYSDRPLFGTKRGGRYHWITYGQFGECVDRLRGGLKSLGVSENDRVAMISDNRTEWAASAYAIMGLGATYVPMYENQNEKDWEHILNDCEAKICMVADDEVERRLKKIRGKLPSLEHIVNFEAPKSTPTSFTALLEKGKASPIEAIRPGRDHIAMFIYTSGTTGAPKGVILSHYNVASNISAAHRLFPIGFADRTLAFLPWAHSFGGNIEMHGAISLGASMGLAESTDTIVDNLPEVQPTVLFAVPRIWNRIYNGVEKQIDHKPAFIQAIFHKAMNGRSKQRDGEGASLLEWLCIAIAEPLIFRKIRKKFGGRLRFAISGAAALAPEVAEFIDNLGIEVYEGYGQTESSPVITTNYPGNRKIGSVGKPLPGCRVELDKSAAPGENEGEIIAYGPNIMQGYHNLPEETKETLTEDDGLRTGDVGWLDEEGYLYITGRVKELYKLETGKFVAPAPVEEELGLSPFISQLMLYGQNKPYNVALIVPEKDALTEWAEQNGVQYSSLSELLENPRVRELYEQEIEKYAEGIKRYEKPKDFTFVEEEFSTENDMLTPTLKFKRRNIMDAYGERIESLYQNGARESG